MLIDINILLLMKKQNFRFFYLAKKQLTLVNLFHFFFDPSLVICKEK